MATGILTISDPQYKPRDMRVAALYIEKITQCLPEIWVFGTVSGGGETAFLRNGKLVKRIRGSSILLEVDGQDGWYSPERLEKTVFVIK